jgi:hypothetical protein
MREFPTTVPSGTPRPDIRPARPRRGEPARVEGQPRQRHDRAQRDARRQRALVSAWLRTLSRAR